MEETSLLQEKTVKQSRLHILYGILNAFIYVIVTVGAAVCVSRLNRSIGDFQLALFRSGFGFLAYGCAILYQKKFPLVPRCHIRTLLLNCFVSNNSIGVFIAVTLVPASSVQCIAITSGIISGIILFAILLSEKFTVKDIIFALLCIFGVIFVVQPKFLFDITDETEVCEKNQNESRIVEGSLIVNNSKTAETNSNVGDINTILVVIGYLLPLATGIMLTGEALVIKKYNYIRDNFNVVAFWSLFSSSIIATTLMAILETPTLPDSWTEALYVLGQSIGFTLSWPTIYFAAQYISGNSINMIFSTSVVFMLLAQYTVLSSIHPGHRNWLEVLGVIFVLVGSSLKSMFELVMFKE